MTESSTFFYHGACCCRNTISVFLLFQASLDEDTLSTRKIKSLGWRIQDFTEGEVGAGFGGKPKGGSGKLFFWSIFPKKLYENEKKIGPRGDLPMGM